MDRRPGSDDMLAEYEQDRRDAAADRSWLSEDDDDDDEEDDDDEDPRPGDPARLLSEQCSTCVFRPGDLMHLAPGRLRSLVRDNLAAGAVLICHQTLPYGEHPEVGEAMCRGFFDAYGQQANVVRVMDRVAAMTGRPWYREVPPPPGH